MTLLESITKISEEKEFEIQKLRELYKTAQEKIDNQREEITNLKNQNFRLVERLKKSSDKYYALTKKKTYEPPTNYDLSVHGTLTNK